jgi:hypothetical protein
MSDQVDTLDEILNDYRTSLRSLFSRYFRRETSYHNASVRLHKETKAKLSAREVAVELNALKEVVAHSNNHNGVWLQKGANFVTDRIKELQQGKQGNSQDDTTPTAVGTKADNLILEDNHQFKHKDVFLGDGTPLCEYCYRPESKHQSQHNEESDDEYQN